ncbi:hypothetical protein SynPROSU1_02706 [Synechococcus sp. PROS-U-1]|nr:hypothetical protein SynPROSU1_02706 [Synechococcus sp. PROS-U-1]
MLQVLILAQDSRHSSWWRAPVVLESRPLSRQQFRLILLCSVMI